MNNKKSAKNLGGGTIHKFRYYVSVCQFCKNGGEHSEGRVTPKYPLFRKYTLPVTYVIAVGASGVMKLANRILTPATLGFNPFSLETTEPGLGFNDEKRFLPAQRTRKDTNTVPVRAQHPAWRFVHS